MQTSSLRLKLEREMYKNNGFAEELDPSSELKDWITLNSVVLLWFDNDNTCYCFSQAFNIKKYK